LETYVPESFGVANPVPSKNFKKPPGLLLSAYVPVKKIWPQAKENSKCETVGHKKIFSIATPILFIFLVAGCSFSNQTILASFSTINLLGYLSNPRIAGQSKVEQLTFTPTIGEYDLLVSKVGNQIGFNQIFNVNQNGGR